MNNFKPQQIQILLNIILFIIVIYNSALVTYRLAKPEFQSSKIYEQDLGAIEFPIYFRICLYELENRFKRYHDIGYRDLWPFFKDRTDLMDFFSILIIKPHKE